MAIIIGVRTRTKNGLIACHTSGATAEESTKSRAKNERDIPFWWNENQKKITIPKTANNAYILCLISLAIAAFFPLPCKLHSVLRLSFAGSGMFL